MLAEIIEEAYDVNGRPISQPIGRRKRKVFHPTYPMLRFLTTPLKMQCSSIAEILQFLRTCKYVPDQEQFNTKDYWLPPEEFETTRKGDCEDFALWAWRQLLRLEIPCRFTVGKAGRYGSGHAWLMLQKDKINYLMECQTLPFTDHFPRLSTARYKPEVSVEWNGKEVKYFQHEDKSYYPLIRKVFPLFLEWLLFWCWYWLKILFKLSLLPYYLTRKALIKLAQQGLSG